MLVLQWFPTEQDAVLKKLGAAAAAAVRGGGGGGGGGGAGLGEEKNGSGTTSSGTSSSRSVAVSMARLEYDYLDHIMTAVESQIGPLADMVKQCNLDITSDMKEAYVSMIHDP